MYDLDPSNEPVYVTTDGSQKLLSRSCKSQKKMLVVDLKLVLIFV